MKLLNRLLLIIIFLTTGIVYSQGGAPSCAELQANFERYQSCATSVPFTNSTNNTSGENFTTTCIEDPLRGPTWFFMKIKTSGSIFLQISQVNNAGISTDVDFVLWGPFNDLNNICSQLDISKEVDCSWLPDSTENVRLPGAVAGEIYILLVDNYSNSPGQITITQTGGSGSSDCSFLSSVKIKDNTGNDITQLNYCKPDTKDLVATIDVTDFPGNASDLRFNYKWYKDGILLTTIANSLSNTNTFTVSDSGLYKVETTAYDSTDPTVNPNDLEVSDAEIDLKFFTAPNMTLQNTNTQCLASNPVLQPVDNNTIVQAYTYEWFRNLTSIPGANGATFTPTLPGTYFARISNAGCPAFDSNAISIYESPQVTISDNQTICENDTYQITSAIANAANLTNVTYQWYKDGNLIPGATSSTYTVSLAGQNAGTTSSYVLEATEQGLCATSSNPVSITINAKPLLNTTPVALQQCDYITPNNDGFAVINLTQAYNSLTNGDSSLTLSYFLDAGLTQQITVPNSFTNTIPYTQNIYVTGINPTHIPICTSNVAVINLTISPTSIANYPDMAPVCPELNANYGFIDFNAKRATIKGASFPTTNVDIAFYNNETDASVEENALTNSSQIPTGISTIYARIENNNNCAGIGTFKVEVYASPAQNAIAPINACETETVILVNKDSEILAGLNPTVRLTYFNTFDNARNNTAAINKNTALPLTVGTKTIFVRQFDTVTQCFSIANFDIRVFANPTITTPDPITICGSNTADFNLDSRISQITSGNTNYRVFFYETPADLASDTPITVTNPYNSVSKTISVKVVDPTGNNCLSTTTLKLNVVGSPGSTTNPDDIEACDDSGFYQFNLTQRQAQMAGTTPLNTIQFRYYIREDDALSNSNNAIPDLVNFTNTVISYQKIYVRLNSTVNINSESGEACYKILELELFVRPFPANNLQEYPYRICMDISNNVVTPAFIDTQLSETDYDFEWYNGHDANASNLISTETGNTFTTSVQGDYSVKITNTTNVALCSRIINFTAKNSLIPFSITGDPAEQITFESDSKVTAIVTPQSPDFQYMIDNNGWQDSNVFNNIKEGIHTLKVRNRYGCGEISTRIVIVDYPKYFTPNGDGFNDTWNIGGRTSLDISNIYIFDRYGKILTDLRQNGIGWDGIYNGRPMPADDYWFKIIYQKDGIKKEFKSHFSLKR
ncbi:T9SS type B sorting domain-containing protein [Flavobacterium microcysteis]